MTSPDRQRFRTLLAEVQALIDARDEVQRRLDAPLGVLLDEYRDQLDPQTIRRVLLLGVDDDEAAEQARTAPFPKQPEDPS